MSIDGAYVAQQDEAGKEIVIPSGPPRSIAERWAILVLTTMHAERDPKTIKEWARYLGISRSALCECCRLVHILPHDARDFARMLRAIARSGERWQPESVLDVADGRTLIKLLARAGFTPPFTWTPTCEQFLEQQRWIDQNTPGINALRRLMSGARS